MIEKLTVAGALAGALLATAAPSRAAEEFPGAALIPDPAAAARAIDDATRPLLQPILAVGAPAVTPAAAPAVTHKTHHHRTGGTSQAWSGKTVAWHRAAGQHAKGVGARHKQAGLHKRSSEKAS